MAYITVTTPVDVVAPGDGKLSLREAVAEANATSGSDTIVFAANIEGKTLTLTRGELVATQDLVIDGDQNNNGVAVILSGGGNSRILRTTGSGTDLTLTALTIQNGEAFEDLGGGLSIGGGTLTLNGCTVRSNSAEAGGAGIFLADGSELTMTRSSVSNNDSLSDGRTAPVSPPVPVSG